MNAPTPDGCNAERERPRVLFLGSCYAGHRTRFENLRRNVIRDGRLDATFVEVTGWKKGGRLESREWLPRALRGRLRALTEVAESRRCSRPDVTWMSIRPELASVALGPAGWVKAPVVVAIDATTSQLEQMAQWYWGRPPRQGFRAARGRIHDRLVRRAVSVFTPWSRWAADGLACEGVPQHRLRILPPGVELPAWRLAAPNNHGRPLRLLFVGGDFVRKGGDLILRAVRLLSEPVQVTLVTSDQVGPLPPGVELVRAAPNSEEIHEAYGNADLFVMPTRADCFGLATVEAMAAGLPTIVGDVGGASDIVEEGVTGWRIRSDLEALVAALEHAIEHRDELPAMGREARRAAERKFDGARNDGRVIDLLLELAADRAQRAVRTHSRGIPSHASER